MHDDMRLKYMVAKGLGCLNVPCLEACNESCPCEKLKNFVKEESKKPSANTASLELEWVHVPTWESVGVRLKRAISIGVVLGLGILLGAGVVKGCCSNEREIKVSLSKDGYQIERRFESIEDFEKIGTNDLRRVMNALESLHKSGNN